MGKVIGILILVIAVWVGMEIFTKGMDSAFGGLLAMGGEATPAQRAAEARGAPHQTPVQRIGARVQQQINAGAVRSTGGLDDSADDEMDPDDDGGSDEFGSEE